MSQPKSNASTNSDMDDWTLISPPHTSSESGSSSPERVLLSSVDNDEISKRSSSNLNETLDSADGLIEVDLNDVQLVRNNRGHLNDIQLAHSFDGDDDEPQTRPSSSDLSGFQAVDDTSPSETTDEELIDKSSLKSSRKPSLTESELGEYVDFGKKPNLLYEGADQDGNIEVGIIAEEDDDNQSTSSDDEDNEDDDDDDEAKLMQRLGLIRTKLDELSANSFKINRRQQITLPKFPTDHSTTNLSELNGWDFSEASGNGLKLKKVLITHLIVWLVGAFLYLLIHLPVLLNSSNNKSASSANKENINSNDWSNLFDMNKFGGLINDGIPTSQQLDLEMRSLHHELSQCIKRQSPASFKYYLSAEDSRTGDKNLLSKLSHSSATKPVKGLVCYGQEARWRKWFKDLKEVHHFDLSKSMTEAKRHISKELLKHYHPRLATDLILNQLEYLNFLENKREKKQSEETIKQLRGENLLLLRRLNQPNETGYHKLVVGLELKNSKLARENQALKEKLLQKAGPTYIKQSIEMERLEKENDLLKKFHYQIARDISRILKQFDLHTIDASLHLDDYDSLNSQLSLTSSYFGRLKEKISSLLLENISLKDELNDSHLLATSLTIDRLNNDASSTQQHDLNFYHDRATNSNSNNNALIADSCRRNLADSMERSSRLEEENDRLRRDCMKPLNNGLEKSFGHQLNASKNSKNLPEQPALSWFIERALSRLDAKDSRSLKMDEKFIDELMMLLTKFGERSNELTISDRITINQLDDGRNDRTPKQEAIKVLPNYLQETLALQKRKNEKPNDQNLYSNSKTKLPLTPPPSFSNRSLKIDEIQPPMGLYPQSNQSKSVLNADLFVSTGINSNGTISIKDSWLFKRAKQRENLRHSVRSNGLNIDWALKRAKLREKLRKYSLPYSKIHSKEERNYSADPRANINRGGKRFNHNKANKSKKTHKYNRRNHNCRDEL